MTPTNARPCVKSNRGGAAARLLSLWGVGPTVLRGDNCQSAGCGATIIIVYAGRVEFPDRGRPLFSKGIRVRPEPVDRRRQISIPKPHCWRMSGPSFRGPVGQVPCDRAGIFLRRSGALSSGQPREREMSGLGDPRFRVSVNLIGAPALSAKDFVNYRQDLIVGVSLQVSAPFGQYDSSKLLNLGNNRWSFRPELGISKAVGPWTFELAPSVTFFSDNTDFFGGNTFAQTPFYVVQGHILYTFQSGAWIALDGVYFSGGHTTLNGVTSDNEQRNTRAGFTVALPIDRQHSLKVSASTGITTRTGSEFSAVGIAWQYRWGDGY